MNAIKTTILTAAVVFAGAIHAQGCSGGADGGMDATGNQCGNASLVGTSAGAVATTPVTTPGTDQRLESASPGVGRQKTTARDARKLVATHIAPRAVPVTTANATSPRTAKADGTRDAACSGGADGGMDATGNQCSAYTQDKRSIAVADAVTPPRKPFATAERRPALPAVNNTVSRR